MKRYALSLCLLLGIQSVMFIGGARPRRGSLTLLKIECESLDQEVIRFPKCEVVKMNKNGPMVINVDLHFVQTIKTVLINAKLFRKIHKTYEAFLYDDVLDICDFLETNSKFTLVWGLLQRMVMDHSNINHSCPYDHDLYMKNLSLDNVMLQVIPLPKGFYMIQLINTMNGIQASRVRVYLERI